MKIISKYILMGACLFLMACGNNHAQDTKVVKPVENNKESKAKVKTEKATFGGGCFWCVEAVYEHVEGVSAMTSGYEGGHLKNPTYKDICTGLSGHAEVVQLEFDPKKVSYEHLLRVFFMTHDPTTLNRQGADVGTQYRSIIFYHSEEQKAKAEAMIKTLNAAKIYDNKIVTKVEKTQIFYKGEDYHQDYYKLNPNQGYCRSVIRPKVEKFLKYLEEQEKKKK